MQKISIEKGIALLFVFFLPFRMISILIPLTSYFGAQASQFSFVFHILGMICVLIRKKGKISIDCRIGRDKWIAYFWMMIGVFALISVAMATYVNSTYGSYNGQSPWIAVLKLMLDFVQYGLIILYSRTVFEILGSECVFKCILWSSRVCLIIGYFQIGVLYNFPGIKTIFTPISRLLSLKTYQTQISITQMEPSWAAMLIGAIIIPFHMARIITKKGKNKNTVLELILWLPIILMTKSTTAYLITATALGVSFIRLIFSSSRSTGIKTVSIIVLVSGILFLNFADYFDQLFGFNFSYLFQSKLTDFTNLSTVARMIPLKGNWEIFKRFPVIGCGNGLQGYFFGSSISREFYSSLYLDSATLEMLNGTSKTIPHGQLFLPGILSGYGLVGITMFVRFIYASVKKILEYREHLGFFGELFLLAIIPIIVSGLKSEFVGIYYIWFVISIPYSAEIDMKESRQYE